MGWKAGSPLAWSSDEGAAWQAKLSRQLTCPALRHYAYRGPGAADFASLPHATLHTVIVITQLPVSAYRGQAVALEEEEERGAALAEDDQIGHARCRQHVGAHMHQMNVPAA